MDKFELGNFIVELESQYPYFWLVKTKGTLIDRDQYSNDIREKFALCLYEKQNNEKKKVKK